MQPVFHGTWRYVQNICDFVYFELLGIIKFHHDALVVGQLLHHFLPFHPSGRIRRDGTECALVQVRGPAALTVKPVASVDQDAGHPSFKISGMAEGVDLFPADQDGVLHGVGCVFVIF